MCCCLPAPVLALPGDRAYELVSPVYKGGYGATIIEAVASDGESVAYYSPGTFAGAPTGISGSDDIDYLSRRGSSGWSSVSLFPPAALVPYVDRTDVSPTLESVLVLGNPGPNGEAAWWESAQQEFLLHPVDTPDVSADWELAGMMLEPLIREQLLLVYKGTSADFCHVLFEKASGAGLVAKAEGNAQLYELVRGCNGEPVEVRLVGLNNKGNNLNSPSCPVYLGTDPYYSSQDGSAFNAVADDGSEIFFTTCINGSVSHHQVFARLVGAKTLEVSRPLKSECVEVPCGKEAGERAGADFAGASRDGSKVFFTATLAAGQTPLVTGDTDVSNNLYMASIGCPSGEGEACETSDETENMKVTSLAQVSHNPNEEEAGVQGVVRVAPDGERAYFVATGDLLKVAEQGVLEREAHPVPHAGADNLYVYEDVSGNEKTAFIGDLCSGFESSGSVEDQHCQSRTGVDSALWSEGLRGEAQTAGVDGRYLVFTTYAQLTAGDTDNAKSVYRYDAETGVLERVSTGEDGYDANGNCDDSGSETMCDANIAPGHDGGTVQEQYEMNNRAISEDGSRIVFTTSQPLSPDSVNGLQNAYEWHEGKVSLISTGTAETPVGDVVISAQGSDVFFVTTQGLVPQDTDSAPDVYDARLGGGFPQGPAEPRPCEGEACYGPLTNPAPLLVPGSVVQEQGENFASSSPSKPVAKAKPKLNKKSKPKKNKKGKAKRAKRDRVANQRRPGR